jgi:hypothetical protein
MKRILDTMNPVPPTTCGSQYIPFETGVERREEIAGRAVKPDIQNTVAPSSWKRQARKEVERRRCLREGRERVQVQVQTW